MEEYTVDQNKGYVAPVSGEASAGHIDDTERRAMANVVSAKAETSRAESAEKDIAGKGNPEAKLYGDIAVETLMPGMKMASAAVEVVDTRNSDVAGLHKTPGNGKTQGDAKTPITIDQDIQSAMRKPGAYRASPTPHDVGVGATAKNPPVSSGRKSASEGEDLMARANIAETSLKGQGKDAIKSWDVPEKKLATVSEAKKLTFGLQLASEKALESVHVARQSHQATLGAVQQRAPHMSLGSGPSINPNTLLREAEQNDKWKTGSS